MLYSIKPNMFKNRSMEYANFRNLFKNDYEKNREQNFIVYNEVTKEAYFFDNRLYLKKIGYKENNPTPIEADYGFVDLGRYESYTELDGATSNITMQKVQKAFYVNYLNRVQHSRLEIKKITQNLRALILSIPEAVRFAHVAAGLYSGKITASWLESYAPVVLNWKKTLEYTGVTAGTPLKMEDSLRYLKSLPNQRDFYLVVHNFAIPVYGKVLANQIIFN